MSKEFDLLVFVGRMQPFHNGHKKIIETALQKADNVLVLIGSAGKARNIRNPFTFEERQNMINSCFDCNGGRQDRLIIKPLYDKMYNDSAWIKQIQEITNETILDIVNPGGFRLNGTNDAKVGLIGAAKDHTSYYLKLFPQWGHVDVPVHNDIHATNIREGFLAGTLQKHECAINELPMPVANFLFNEFKHGSEYPQLQKELLFVRDYKKQWKAAPYPVTFVTVDAVVEQSGHILLVKRRSEPGKGLWALPGGHLEVDEKIMDGIMRELKEETLIKVPEAVLRGSVVATNVFDDPNRSNLGRVITHAAHIRLTNDLKLPKVKGADDAEKARFTPISEIREDMMFDDHYAIIQYFLGA